jgi:hypothetical protein
MRTRIGCCIAVAVTALLGAAAPAAAEDFECNGVLTGPIPGNVVAPQGSACTLFNAQIAGNVFAFEGSTLSAESSEIAGNTTVRGATSASLLVTFVGGDVTTVDTGHTSVDLFSTVGGNLEVVEGGGFSLSISEVIGNLRVERTSGLIEVGETLIRGEAQFFDNGAAGPAASLDVVDNIVLGNLQVYRTRGLLPKVVADNRVGQNVQCFDNDPPFVGGPNEAQQSQGQCF